jgi:hypothetical protein
MGDLERILHVVWSLKYCSNMQISSLVDRKRGDVCEINCHLEI